MRALIVLCLSMAASAAFAQQPRIDTVSPSQGPIAGGAIVTVAGVNLAGAAVTLDGIAITALSQSDTAVSFQTPKHDNGFAVIRIGSAAAAFLYQPPKLEELPPGYITTVAGIGRFARDYGPATQASISALGLQFDHAGNLYLSDTHAGVIYRIRTDGMIERFAGGGDGPDPGDGGPATKGYLVFPRDIAVDGHDNVYIPHVFNCRVRKVDLNGIITTVAGTGVCGFSGDGGPATQAQIGEPSHITADSDDLFFIDFDAMRIRRLHFADGTISTFAGSGVAGFSGDGGPATQASFNITFADAGGLALDPGGNLYLTDNGNSRVRRIDRRTGIITTFCAADPTAWPIAFDLAGNLYLGNESNIGGISKFDSNGQLVTSWGNGQNGLPVDGVPAATASINSVGGVAIDRLGNIVFSDRSIQRVRKINVSTGLFEAVAGIGPAIIGENGPATATVVAMSPEATELAIAATGELLIGDAGSSRLRRLERNGNLTTIAGNGTGFAAPADGALATGGLIYPVGIDVSTDGNIRVAQRSVGDFVRIDSSGLLYHLGGGGLLGYTGDGGPLAKARFCQPWDLAHDRDGNLFIADTNNNRVRRIDAKTSVVTTIVGNGGPVNGFERYGNGKSCGDGGPAIDACINTPYGVALDPAGNLYVAEQTGIRKVDSAGMISMFAILPGYAYGGATKIRFDSRGLLYTLFGNHPLRIDSRGRITYLGGQAGKSGFAGDGGPARDALLNTGGQAVGIAIDADGNLFFLDSANHRIRAIRYGAVLAPSGATIQATASGSTIQATVFDANGQPAPGVRVDFTAPSAGPSCHFPNNANTISVVTDASGVATTSCVPNCIGAGSFPVTAQPLTAIATPRVTMSDTAGPCRRRAARH